MRHVSLLLLAVLLFTLTGCATNPVTGRRQLALISESQEIATGNEAFPVYTQAFMGEFQDDPLQNYVTRVGKTVAALSHRPNLDYQFKVVNTSEINAFALPGGKIMITRGLLGKFDNEAQMAGVLSHEVGHVAAQHYISDASQQLLINLMLVAGAVYMEHKGYKYGDVALIGAYIGSMMYLAHYSRDQERQADQLGVDYMVRAGYEPQAYVSVMEMFLKMRESEPNFLERLFATHPLTAERIRDCSGHAQRYLAARAPNAPPLTLAAANYTSASRRLFSVAPAYALMDEGDKLQEEGSIRAAIAKYNEAVRRAPDQAVIYLSRAQALMEEDDLSAAERDISSARRYYPDLFYTRYFAGKLNIRQERWRNAVTELKAADRLLPGVTEVQYLLGRSYESLGNNSEAAKYYTKFLEDEPEGEEAEYTKGRLRQWGLPVPGEQAQQSSTDQTWQQVFGIGRQ